MKQVDASRTKRAQAFEMWMHAPMPMVTLFQTLDVSNLVKWSKKSGFSFHMLMCWCIGKAASQMEEFYLLPVGEQLMQYDRLAVNTVVATDQGGISTCDIPFCKNLNVFRKNYGKLTRRVRKTGKAFALGDDYMVIGTSALVPYQIDGAVNIYAGCYNNPFLIWGAYRKKWFKKVLPISFQFHHTQMDGLHAARFLEALQREIRGIKFDR